MFAESLPSSCPPEEAANTALTGVYRMSGVSPATPECFYSHLKLGKAVPSNFDNICSWASCSLTTDPASLVKLPAFRRRRFALELDIPVDAGLSLAKCTHVDFWMLDGFDPVGAVVNVVHYP